MKSILTASIVTVLAFSMLLPVMRPVNAASVNPSVLRQAGTPMPGSGGGGHYISRQGGTPMPGSGGGGH